LLPGIDDGAKTFEDSLRLTRALQALTEIITTPHIIQNVWDNTHEGIASKKVETIQQLEKITLQFLPSRSRVPDGRSICTAFQSHDLLTLKDNYVLVEMSYINAPIQLYYILFDLQVAGYIPVLAHPSVIYFITTISMSMSS
jgi:tyrosine-protein phosphatase YwqE